MTTKRAAQGEHALRVKRIYDAPAEGDGVRILVDRLWPRGTTKEKAGLDEWLKDVAPSEALRKRVHGATMTWTEFAQAYTVELGEEPARSAATSLLARLEHGPVTLLFAAQDEVRNNAVTLAEWLRARRTRGA